MSVPATLMETRGLSKSFGGVHAVEDVSISLNAGEVVALVGHNGAGKSTLIKMLAGVIRPESGQILIDGNPVSINSEREAQHFGIETIHQTLALADNLDAPANMFLGREITNMFGFLREHDMEQATIGTLERMKLRLPSLHKLVSSMSGGQRQAVAISRAIHFNARVLIMDEPTAALGPEETAKVAQLIRELSSQGIGIFLISHDIHDVFELSDRIVVLKSGRVVGQCDPGNVTKDDVLELIILGEARHANGRRIEA